MTPKDSEPRDDRTERTKIPEGEINCFSCRHFYITYDPRFPYGCRAAGFKSRGMPSREMMANSQMACQFFAVKGKAS